MTSRIDSLLRQLVTVRTVCALSAAIGGACSGDAATVPIGPVGAGAMATTIGGASGSVSGSGGMLAVTGASGTISSAAGGGAGRAGATAVAGSAGSVAGAAAGASGMAASIGGAGGSPVAGAAGMVAGAGAAGTAGGNAMAGSGAAVHEDLGKGDGKDVIAIGDSWMLLSTTGIQTGLLKASGQPYRVYGVPGTQLTNGQIPGQYTSAKREDPDIKTVVMTGGGNDLLLTGSTSGSAATTAIDNVAKGLIELWTQMGTDGVKDIVYIEYSRGGTNEMNVNTGTEKIRPMCAAFQPARCHWVDSDETIMMQLRDGIHPTDAGYDALGKTVYMLMEKEGMRR
jgi:GDSL-like Lipase/Acylhydrolase family